ncbi:hypothetical protein Y032_0125g1294 [Ancylostoma ceylanicum]|uniref:Uncharacterized protein n=1 Tax=Ancylostoma ceylanicum TaxID=53326 RepID=A0A016T8T9_9BILA|nr:hypothetical protein Y032_0125g1294 [Ancylostoma ceylanicum]
MGSTISGRKKTRNKYKSDRKSYVENQSQRPYHKRRNLNSRYHPRNRSEQNIASRLTATKVSMTLVYFLTLVSDSIFLSN